MHFLKTFGGISTLYAVLTTCATMLAQAAAAGDLSAESNLKSRDESTDKTAIVNVYSGGTCGGGSTSFTQVNGGAICHFNGGNSIEVSAKYANIYYKF